MNAKVKYLVAAVLLAGLISVLTTTGFTGDPTEDLQEAYLKGTLSLQEVVTKKDSVFAIVNRMYQPVKPILQKSCFDCHSEYTSYPWYHKLPLIKGMIDDDIKEGRENLDMSNDFPFGGKTNSLELLAEIKKEIEEGDMPPLNYRLVHWGKLIEGQRRDSLFNWIDSTTAILNDFYDKLIPKDEEDTLQSDQ